MLYSTILGILSAAVVQCRHLFLILYFFSYGKSLQGVLVTRTHALYQQRWLTIFLGILGFVRSSLHSSYYRLTIPCRFQCLVHWSFFSSCFNLKHVSNTPLFPYCANLLQLISVTPASTLGLSGCILGCTNGMCKPMLIGFWIPFVLFETSELLHFVLRLSWDEFPPTSHLWTHRMEIIQISWVDDCSFPAFILNSYDSISNFICSIFTIPIGYYDFISRWQVSVANTVWLD